MIPSGGPVNHTTLSYHYCPIGLILANPGDCFLLKRTVCHASRLVTGQINLKTVTTLQTVFILRASMSKHTVLSYSSHTPNISTFNGRPLRPISLSPSGPFESVWVNTTLLYSGGPLHPRTLQLALILLYTEGLICWRTQHLHHCLTCPTFVHIANHWRDNISKDTAASFNIVSLVHLQSESYTAILWKANTSEDTVASLPSHMSNFRQYCTLSFTAGTIRPRTLNLPLRCHIVAMIQVIQECTYC